MSWSKGCVNGVLGRWLHWLIIYTSINMTSIIHFGHRTGQQFFFFFRLVLFVIFPLVNYIYGCLIHFSVFWVHANGCSALIGGCQILISQFFWFLTTIFRIRDMFVLVGSKMSCAVFDLVFVFTWYVNLCARFGRISHSNWNWTCPKSKGVSFPVTAYLIIWSLQVSRMKYDLFYY